MGGFRVELQGVTKRFEAGARTITALDSVSFALEPGSVLAVTGPSGSGKSTLLHVVGAMDEPDGGSISVGEFAVSELDRRAQVGYRRRIGFVFQHFHLLPALTALDNVAAPLLPYRVDFDKQARARKLLAAVGLEGREDDLPSQLSGGEQQRVALARALVNDPGLLLADEPTGNLDSVSFALEPGGVLAVTGPSGSGKSTLLHMVGAMDEADAGSITVGDFAVHELDGRAQVGYRRRIGFVFQYFHLLPALTTRDNVAAPLLPYRVDFDKHERALELLAAVGLEGREDDLPSQLSGGEQQRVALARALVNDPGLLLADEPTGNLDSETGLEIVQLLLDLRAQRGMTVIIVTHNPLVAARGDRVARLHDGRLLDDVEVPRAVPPEEMLARISRIEP